MAVIEPAMHKTVSLIIPFFWGAATGLVFYGGLWWTVKRLPFARHPSGLSVISFIVRTGFALTVFYLVMAGRWERISVCLIGFITARTLLVRFWGKRKGPSRPAGG